MRGQTLCPDCAGTGTGRTGLSCELTYADSDALYIPMPIVSLLEHGANGTTVEPEDKDALPVAAWVERAAQRALSPRKAPKVKR